MRRRPGAQWEPLSLSDHGDQLADQLRDGVAGGLSVNTSTGLISGTPTATGTSTVALSATNGSGTGNATLTLTITVASPVITSATTAGGTLGNAFSYQITATNSPTSFTRRDCRGPIGEFSNGLDLGNADSNGNVDGGAERDQRQRDRHCDSDADDLGGQPVITSATRPAAQWVRRSRIRSRRRIRRPVTRQDCLRDYR